MVWIRGIGRVRAGSWGTKPALEQWRMTRKQLEDASLVMVPRLRYLMFDEGSEMSQSQRRVYESEITYQLESLRDQINTLLKKRDDYDKAARLENVAGRTPEEAELYRAKAAKLREG